MSVHISEIGVKLTVGSKPAAAAAPAGHHEPRPGPTPEMVEEIVIECVQRILEILRAVEAR